MNILITGASKGIGKALAWEFARHGHALILCARSEDLLAEMAANIKEKHHVQVHYLAMDLSASDADQQLMHWLDEKDIEIQCLVNNVGIGHHGDYAAMSVAEIDTMMQLNMQLLARLTLRFARQFKERRHGYILQVASIAGFMPGPHIALYYASKAFVISLSRAIAYEMEGDGVYVSTLCPGPTKTDFFEVAGLTGTRLAGGAVGLMPAERVAKVGYKGLMRGKSVIIPGLINKFLIFSTRFAPVRLNLWITRQLFQKNTPEEK